MPDYVDDALLKRQLLALDVLLRKKQGFWETPRAIWLIVIVAAAVAGPLGYTFGRTLSMPRQIIVHFDQPIIVKLQ